MNNVIDWPLAPPQGRTKTALVLLLMGMIFALPGFAAADDDTACPSGGVCQHFDLGDLPNSYATTLAAVGAIHEITYRSPYLGTCVDGERDGQPSADAARDDLAASSSVRGTCRAGDDEDGVWPQNGLGDAVGWTEGTVAGGDGGSLSMTFAGGGGYPTVCVDFNHDGDFDSGEQTVLRWSNGSGVTPPLGDGTRRFYFDVPAGALKNPDEPIAVRVRLSNVRGVGCTGPATSGVSQPDCEPEEPPLGEVEDNIFRLVPEGRVGDMVWHDDNRDAAYVVGSESPIASAAVHLLQETAAGTQIINTTTTSAAILGNYLFSGLSAGTYFVDVDESGFSATFPTNTTGNEGPVKAVLAAGGEILSVDFGYDNMDQDMAGIGDKVYVDFDEDAVFNGRDVGLCNIELFLKDAGGTIIDKASTDSFGNYKFVNLPASQYYSVRVDLQDPDLDPHILAESDIDPLTVQNCDPDDNQFSAEYLAVVVTLGGGLELMRPNGQPTGGVDELGDNLDPNEFYPEADFGFIAKPTSIQLAGVDARDVTYGFFEMLSLLAFATLGVLGAFVLHDRHEP